MVKDVALTGVRGRSFWLSERLVVRWTSELGAVQAAPACDEARPSWRAGREALLARSGCRICGVACVMEVLFVCA